MINLLKVILILALSLTRLFLATKAYALVFTPLGFPSLGMTHMLAMVIILDMLRTRHFQVSEHPLTMAIESLVNTSIGYLILYVLF